MSQIKFSPARNQMWVDVTLIKLSVREVKYRL
jgi:hypothetical protein